MGFSRNLEKAREKERNIMAYGHGARVGANGKDLAANGGYIRRRKRTWRDNCQPCTYASNAKECEICKQAVDIPKGSSSSDEKICTLCKEFKGFK